MKPRKSKDLDIQLKKKGFVPTERDHVYYFLYYKNKKTSIFTKISHGIKEYSNDLLSQMAKELSLTNTEFEQLIDCPLTHEGLISLLLAKSKIRE